MQIDVLERPDLVRGVCDLRREQNGIALDRMNAALREFYSDSEARIDRARSRAGVRIVLRSNTRWLKIALRFGRRARNLLRGDLFCDGDHLGSFGSDDSADAWAGEVFQAEVAEPRDLEIWLPHCAEAFVQAIEVEDGAVVEALEPPEKAWLAVGDSITQGMAATTPGRIYAHVAARQAGLNLHDIGVGGGTAEPEIGVAAQPIACDVATLLFGANDVKRVRTADEFRDKTIALTEGLLQGRPDLPVGLITPLPTPGRALPSEASLTLEELRDALRNVPDRLPSVRVIDGPSLVPADECFFNDGVHPNDEGMKSIGENLAPHLREMIGSTTGT